MASITASGTWVPAGPSRKASGWPSTVRLKAGKSRRAFSQSAAVNGMISPLDRLKAGLHSKPEVHPIRQRQAGEETPGLRSHLRRDTPALAETGVQLAGGVPAG